MRVVMFYHSLRSDWNHGNAHFLRGVVRELMQRGHQVTVYEPADGWSAENLTNDHGQAALHAYREAYPSLKSVVYDPGSFDLKRDLPDAVRRADLVLVHEWSDPQLVAALGSLRGNGYRTRGDFRLLFHDTHHRGVSAPEQMETYDLSGYDGVLAFGEVLRELYLRNSWTHAAWTWHEAADHRVFRPRVTERLEGDVVWVGNWGDDERTEELEEFLLGPVARLGLRATVYGVRYPPEALAALERAGIHYAGYLPNHRVPEVFSRYRLTLHVPRRFYTQQLPGIPTIRVFEALACGTPLLCSPWRDSEHLFCEGQDYLMARDGRQIQDQMQQVLEEPLAAQAIADHGRRTVLSRHTCGHRVEQLLSICCELELDPHRDGRSRGLILGSQLPSSEKPVATQKEAAVHE